jgi:hypothetical protein
MKVQPSLHIFKDMGLISLQVDTCFEFSTLIYMFNMGVLYFILNF